MAERILMNELKTLSKEKWVKVELVNDDILTWSIALIILNPSSLYYSAYLKATMTFPSNYPYSPPTFKFTRPLTHPNIYPDGKLCISILHAPGEDEMSGESAGERWSPVQRVESVLLSIISLLDDAECSSPANVDAGVLLRKSPNLYRTRVRDDVEKSKQDIPAGFVMPTSMVDDTAASKAFEKSQSLDDKDFWVDSDMGEEDDFGGSDTDDQNMVGYDEDEDLDQDAVDLQEDEEDQAEEDEETMMTLEDEDTLDLLEDEDQLEEEDEDDGSEEFLSSEEKVPAADNKKAQVHDELGNFQTQAES